MIFNITSGGIAEISVTAPSGASISASCSGVTVTGSGTCTLEVPIIGTWTVTCVYDGTTKNSNVSVESFGETYSVTFTYTATLTVTTFPGATVAISTTGHSDSKTATGGTATFTIPAGKLGIYNISSSYASTWSGSAQKDVNAYGTDFPVTINLSVPDFKFVVGSTTYTFTKDSSTSSNSDYYFYKSGANWEFYAKTSGTLKMTANTVVDLFLCGGGSNGVNANGYNTCPGGNGGARKTVSNQTISGNLAVVVGGAGLNSSIGNYSSSGGAISAGSAASSTSAGEDGGYCFDDSSAKCPDGNSRKVGAGGGHGAYAETNGSTVNIKKDRTSGGDYQGATSGSQGKGGNSKIDGTGWYADNGEPGGYYGAGGGGAGVYWHSQISDRRGKGNPGAGHSGVAAMRNKR